MKNFPLMLLTMLLIFPVGFCAADELFPAFYSNDFSVNATGFTPGQPWELKEGEFRFNGGKADQFYDNVFTTLVAPDFQYQAKVKWLGGADDNGFGLVFRYLDADNFCSFEISKNGSFRVVKLIKGYDFELVPWKMTSLIRENTDNLLRVVCGAKYIKCYINDKLVASTYDNDFNQTPGRVGFTSGGDLLCGFDNFTLRELAAKEKYGVGPEAPQTKLDFSDGPGGFGASGPWSISNGELLCNNNQAGVFSTNVPNDDYATTLSISVRARWIGGDPDNGFGIIFGYRDRENFYDFQITQNGGFRVSKQSNNQWRDLVSWKDSSAISRGPNQLRVTCQAKTINCYINDILVASLPETLSGNPYLAAGLGVSSNIKCSFDDYTVREIMLE